MLRHLFERGKSVFLFGYYSGLVSKTTLKETDKIITNCFACVCVCVFIHAKKKWQKFFKGKSLKDSKRQDLKRLDWCLSFQIVVPIASTKNGSNVLRLKYLRCSVSWVFKSAWAHMGSSALPGWTHYQRYLAFCPVLREVSEPRMTAMARTFAPCKGIRIPESGIFCSWNPESNLPKIHSRLN